ncbi:hypothetical protein FKP32DRAFT_1762897, partial [Trametes sanguinea]
MSEGAADMLASQPPKDALTSRATHLLTAVASADSSNPTAPKAIVVDHTALAKPQSIGHPTGTSSIQSLPAELFCEVLYNLWPEDRVTASHVCRRWRNIALADPRVWQVTLELHEDMDSDAMVAAFLERSKPLPVQINVSLDAPPDTDILQTRLRTVAQELGRMKELELYVPDETPREVVLQAIQGAAPLLEHLAIFKEPHDTLPSAGENMTLGPSPAFAPAYYERSHLLNFDGAPRLRSMEAFFIPLPYLPMGPTKLTDLLLTWSPTPVSPLLDLLERSPDLRNLELTGLPLEWQETAHRRWAVERRRIQLPHLSSLSGFHTWPASLISAFFSMLVIPETTRIYLSVDGFIAGENAWTDVADMFPADFPPLQEARRLELVGLPNKVSLHVYQDVVACRAPPVRINCVIGNMRDRSWGVAHHWPFRTDDVRALILCDILSPERRLLETSKKKWLAMLRRLPALESLRLLLLSDKTLASLADVLQAEPSLCPNLVKVELSST